MLLPPKADSQKQPHARPQIYSKSNFAHNTTQTVGL